MNILTRKVRILIIDDRGPTLSWLKGRIDLFWPPEIPAKATAVYCAWAEEAIEAIKEYQPDILLLNYTFAKDDKTGRDVACWIDEHYRSRLRVAAHTDRPDEDLRQLFRDTRCVTHFIHGDRIKEFIEDLIGHEGAEG